MTYMRFLKAREFDPIKAHKMVCLEGMPGGGHGSRSCSAPSVGNGAEPLECVLKRPPDIQGKTAMTDDVDGLWHPEFALKHETTAPTPPALLPLTCPTFCADAFGSFLTACNGGSRTTWTTSWL